MPDPFGDINTMYSPYGKLGVNEEWRGPPSLSQQQVAPNVVSDEIMDEDYTPQTSENSYQQSGMFSNLLGPNVDIYDPSSIVAGLSGLFEKLRFNKMLAFVRSLYYL